MSSSGTAPACARVTLAGLGGLAPAAAVFPLPRMLRGDGRTQASPQTAAAYVIRITSRGLLYPVPRTLNSYARFVASTMKTDTTDVRKRLVRVIERRARRGEAGAPTAAMARLAYDDLAGVLVPLVSQSGFDALMVRAFQLAQREYPADVPALADGQQTDPFVQVGLWLDRQDERNTTDAAAAMFEALAALLTTMIGESLTTQYLRKAWPEDFPAGRSKGTRA